MPVWVFAIVRLESIHTMGTTALFGNCSTLELKALQGSTFS